MSNSDISLTWVVKSLEEASDPPRDNILRESMLHRLPAREMLRQVSETGMTGCLALRLDVQPSM